MAVVEFPYSEFRKFVDIPKEKLIEVLNTIGAPAELGEGDSIITEITPNRPDWFLLTGLARSIKSYTKKKTSSYSTKKSTYKVVVDSSVSSIRPYTVCGVVKGLNLNSILVEQLIQFQEKLIGTLGRKVRKFGMGFFPLPNIVFPLRYTTLKPKEIIYKPLNYPKVADAEEILSKHPKGIENGYLLKNFDRYPVYLDKNGKILVLIPIVNSEETGKIDENTKDLFIEVTGSDLNTVKSVLNLVCANLVELGGEVFEVEMSYPSEKFSTPNLAPRKMKFTKADAEDTLGIKLSDAQILNYFKMMDFNYKNKSVEIPPYRTDILHEVDLIEDIAIAHGYNNFKQSMPNFFSAGKENDRFQTLEETMRGMGFREIKTFLLNNRKNIEKFGYLNPEEVLNPASEDFNALKPTGIISLLEVFRVNKTKGLPQKFYEIADTYYESRLSKKLVFGIADISMDFSKIQSALQSLSRELGLDIEVKSGAKEVFMDVESGSLFSNGKQIGIIGKVKKEFAELGEFSVFVCEVELNSMPKAR